MESTFPEMWEKPITAQPVGARGEQLYEAVYGSDKELAVRFYWQPVVNEQETLLKNVKVIEQKEFIRIQRIGEKLTVYQGYAEPKFIRRFPMQYQAFKEGKGTVQGIPLESWDYQLSETDILTFKMLGIHYVHQLAAMSPDQQDSLGLDAKRIVTRARIDTADQEVRDQAASLQRELEEMREMFKQQSEENAHIKQMMLEKQNEQEENEKKERERLLEVTYGSDEAAKALAVLDEVMAERKFKS